MGESGEATTVNTAESSLAISPPQSQETTLPPEILERIERNRRAAQEKRKLFMSEAASVRNQNETSGSVSPQVVPKSKRQKTDEEILREEELKEVISHGQVVRVQGYKLIDTGGGFLLDERDLIEEEETPKNIVTEPPPIILEAPTCELCNKTFSTSFLFHTYDHHVCDACRDTDGLHSYITRTDAKQQFLLKDEDFDKREPVLKYISRPNPHNPRWGDMKLYLRLQIEKRAIEVWGSLDNITAQRDLREENRVKTKIQKYNKKMNKLRMAARSSLYTRDLSAHTHVWGPEVYRSDSDDYTHTCKDCGKTETYEKM